MLIRPIENAAELDQVHALIYSAYVREGYCRPRAEERLRHFPHLDTLPETTVLIAIQDHQIVGTNSLTLDGPQGLHTDLDFQEDCDLVRKEGRNLAASWRIATHQDHRDTRKVVMSLIQKTVDLCLQQKVQTCLFTFNPRHERIYRRLLNMSTLAQSQHSSGLTNAPSILMRWNLETCPSRWLAASRAGRKLETVNAMPSPVFQSN